MQYPQFLGDFIELKQLITFILVLLLLVLAYIFFFSKNAFVDKDLEYEAASLSNQSEFSSLVQSSKNVFIVMDLRGSSEKTRANIMQCGTDFAGSEGLAGKNITTYALEGGDCFTSDGKSEAKTCLSSAKANPAIFIKSGSGSVFYNNRLVVGVTDVYSFKDCDIKIKNSNE